MSNRELDREDITIIKGVLVKVFPIIVEKYSSNQLETATRDMVAALKAGLISIKTDSKQ